MYKYLYKNDLGKVWFSLPFAAKWAGVWLLVRLPRFPGCFYYLRCAGRYFSFYSIGLRVKKDEDGEYWIVPAWPCDLVLESGRESHVLALLDVALDVETAQQIIASV